VLLSRGDPEPEVVVIGILILLAVEHGLLSKNVERRRRKLGDRHLERLRWPRRVHEPETSARGGAGWRVPRGELYCDREAVCRNVFALRGIRESSP
jgi:hypothetical protein